MAKTLNYSEVSDKLNDPSTILIDVREIPELQTDGKIQGSKNIPVGEVTTAFKLNDDQFKQKYGFLKPELSAEVIIYCKSGVRAGNAAKVLADIGYANVLVYPGILDWVKNGGKVEK